MTPEAIMILILIIDRPAGDGQPGGGVVRSFTSAVVAFTLFVAACGAESPPDRGGRPLIVATTSILGSVAESAFGSHADIGVLIDGSRDPHSYQPTPSEAAALRHADVVLANGLGLEEALASVLDAAVADGAIVLYASEVVAPLPGGAPDPHFWFDPTRMETVVLRLAALLGEVEGAGAVDWRALADSYAVELRAIDEEIAGLVATLPVADRRLVTNHESLAYFADRYGFRIIGTVIPGSTIAEPSAADLAELVMTVDREAIPVIFGDTTSPARLAEIVAAEVGFEVAVVPLHTGGLGPAGSGAETYTGYLRTNATLIVQALAA